MYRLNTKENLAAYRSHIAAIGHVPHALSSYLADPLFVHIPITLLMVSASSFLTGINFDGYMCKCETINRIMVTVID